MVLYGTELITGYVAFERRYNAIFLLLIKIIILFKLCTHGKIKILRDFVDLAIFSLEWTVAHGN